MWKASDSSSSIDAACAEAESVSEGRYNGTCTAMFGSVFTGFSAQVWDISAWSLTQSSHPIVYWDYVTQC